MSLDDYEKINTITDRDRRSTFLVTDREKIKRCMKEYRFGLDKGLESFKAEELFETEVKTLRSLNHRQIPKLIDFFREGTGKDERLYFIMEFFEEKNLEIYKNRLQNTVKSELVRLEQSKISPRNKELIHKFRNYLATTTSKGLRVSKLSSQIRRVCMYLEKDLDITNKEDIQKIILYYNDIETYSDATKSDYRRAIKQFYKWFEDEDDRLESDNKEIRLEAVRMYKFLKKDVKTGYKIRKADPKTILTDEDIDYILEHGCRNIREKAIVKFLHETGCRVGELLNLHVGDLDFNNESHAMVRLDGKTGERHIAIVTSAPLLIRYLENHPFRKDSLSFLWISENRRCLNQPLMYNGVVGIVDDCFKRAGMGSKIHNLHWFRHSRGTLLAPHLTEAILCKYMGWEIGSKQVRVYTHLRKKQVTDAILQMKGIKANTQEEYKDTPKKCVCDTINEATAQYCYKCGKPLSLEVAIKNKEVVDEEINKTMQLFMEIAKNPELMKKFEEFKKNIF